jgi:hypothetical protein
MQFERLDYFSVLAVIGGLTIGNLCDSLFCSNGLQQSTAKTPSKSRGKLWKITDHRP